MFATYSFADTLFWWLIILPFAFHGFRKMGKWFDDKGEIKDAAQKGTVSWIKRMMGM